MNWWERESTTPIRVEGGIRARSARGPIGANWWSRRFIEVLESYGSSGRLTRGRNYARVGQVMDLEIGKGRVSAQVQGSRAKPYTVDVRIRQLTAEQWHEVEEALAAQALFRAKLLAGEMPPEIEEVFEAIGAPLFPRSWGDFALLCSCPDATVPCKHLAAVFYLLAEAFDRDPFLVLRLRGRDRDELLDLLRARSGGPGGDAGAGPEIAVDDVPLADRIGDFWSPSISPARLRERPPPARTVPDLLLRVLEPPPVEVAGRPLTDVVAPAYTDAEWEAAP